MSTCEAETILCDNGDHDKPVRAYARITWPDGRFKPETACAGCLRKMIRWYVFGGMPGERHSMHIDLIGKGGSR